MKPLFLCELIDLIREGAAATGDANLKVRDVKPLAMPLELILEMPVVAYSISAISLRKGGTAFARHYVAIQTGDAAGGMVEVDPGLSDEQLVHYAVRMISGDGMKQVAALDITV